MKLFVSNWRNNDGDTAWKDVRLGPSPLDPSAGHCTADNGPGNDAKRIADDDSDWSAAIRGQLNARQMDSGYYLVNLVGS